MTRFENFTLKKMRHEIIEIMFLIKFNFALIHEKLRKFDVIIVWKSFLLIRFLY
jgi:hypothetical protein